MTHLTRMISAIAQLTAPSAKAAGNGPEAEARMARVRVLRTTANTPDMPVPSSSFSEAGTEAIPRAGETGTWRRIAHRDGTTADTTSMTDEGTH